MPIQVETLEREFVFEGRSLPCPGSHLTVEQVREIYIPSNPDITTATVVGPEAVGGKMRYTFTRAIGHKG